MNEIVFTGDDFPDAQSLLEAVLNLDAQPEEMGVSTPTAGPSTSGTNRNQTGPPNSQPGSVGNQPSSGLLLFTVMSKRIRKKYGVKLQNA